MPETCVPYGYIPPPTRQEVIDSCPGLGASPTQVRDWLTAYLLYRGLDSYKAEGFFWRGAELHRATLPILVEAFKKHCRIRDWEADILAQDVFTIVEPESLTGNDHYVKDKTDALTRHEQNSIPPPHRSLFQRYVESIFGCEFYGKLIQWRKPVVGFLGRANCIFCWAGLVIIHVILGFISMVIVGFLLNIS